MSMGVGGGVGRVYLNGEIRRFGERLSSGVHLIFNGEMIRELRITDRNVETKKAGSFLTLPSPSSK